MNSHAPPTPESDTQSETPRDRVSIIRWIVLAIIAWGIFHAVGAWQFNHDPRRAVVVLVCVATFLGFWMTMLAVRQRRLTKGR
jgi:CHASE2 domain-containing sensor protein